jgi:hypothetical protein
LPISFTDAELEPLDINPSLMSSGAASIRERFPPPEPVPDGVRFDCAAFAAADFVTDGPW